MNELVVKQVSVEVRSEMIVGNIRYESISRYIEKNLSSVNISFYEIETSNYLGNYCKAKDASLSFSEIGVLNQVEIITNIESILVLTKQYDSTISVI